MVVILVARIQLDVRDDGRRRIERVVPMIEVWRANRDGEAMLLEEYSPDWGVFRQVEVGIAGVAPDRLVDIFV